MSDHLLPLSSYKGHITYIYYELIPVALLIVNLNFPSLLFIDVVFTFPKDTVAILQRFIYGCLDESLMTYSCLTFTIKGKVTNESINKMEQIDLIFFFGILIILKEGSFSKLFKKQRKKVLLTIQIYPFFPGTIKKFMQTFPKSIMIS